ncbi:MAG: hypothetical protein V3T30_00990 [Thermodesulfobacteriota bacterium]
MNDQYLKAKAVESAVQLAARHRIAPAKALRITETVWREARRALLKVIKSYGEEKWHELSLEEKSMVCRTVIKGLLDKQKIEGFLNGDRREII